MSDAIRVEFPARRVVRLGVLTLALLLILANAVVAFITLGDLRTANLRVERTLQAILALKNLQDLADAGALHQQAYRLAGDAAHLQEAQQAHTRMPAMLARVRSLSSQDRTSADLVGRLTSLVEQSNAATADALAPATPGLAPVPPPVSQDDVVRARAINESVDALIDHEESRLDTCLATITTRSTTAVVTAIAGAAGGALLISIIFAMMRRDIRRTEQLAVAHSGALRDSEQRFRRIFEESPLGILVADLSGSILQANPAFCRMLGRNREQFIGKSLPQLAHVEDRAPLREAIERGAVPDQGVEARFVARSGVIAWASVRLARLPASRAGPGLLLGLTEDITRERRVEGELRQAQKMEAIGQLTGGIAHDFNNLLGVIIGNAEFLLDTVHDPNEAAMVKEVLDAALSGADLTRRLLAFARRQSLQPRRIDLNAYLPNHVAILRRLLGEQIDVTTILADDLWPTRADPSQVGDALLNLAINARDAMPHGGTIWIATGNVHVAAEDDRDDGLTPGDYVTLAVTDTGTGMPPEVLERAVEPFFSTKGPGAGSGLGLSMIFGFAKQSGGHLQIDSQPGLGCTVRLYLPRAQTVDEPEADEDVAAPLPGGHEAVLLVDDNPDMRAVARRHLEALGYRVREAASGPSALDLLRDDPDFDLLFTDVVMAGGMTGYQLAEAARRLHPRLRVLFTTGYARMQAGSEQPATAAGGTLRKPYRRRELAAMVRAALEA